MKKVLFAVASWLDRKFPDKMTTSQVQAFISKQNERDVRYTDLLENILSRVEVLEKKQERDVTLELQSIKTDIQRMKSILGWSSVDTLETILPK